MIRIAVLTGHFPSSSHPTLGRPAYETLRVLSRKCDVQVFYPHAVYPSLLKPRSRIYNPIDDYQPLPHVKVGYHDYPALRLVSRPFNGWMAARVIMPYLRCFAPDIIFSYFLYPDGYAALAIAKSLSVPVVAMGVGSDVHSIGDPLSAMHTRTVLQEADILVGISEDLRKRMVAMGATPERTRTIISGCDPSVFHTRDRLGAREQLHMDQGGQAVVYIGRMDVKKGLRELIEAAAALHPHRPNLHVYLVGEGPDRPILEKLIHSMSATNYIHALPACAFDEVAIWMAAANVFTLPSYMEGCPNVVLEALASGRPVVATNVGGIPEIMDDNCGQLVPPRDTAALTRALEAVLDRDWDAEAISARCSRSWSDVASELLEVFEELVSARQARIHAR